MNREFDIAKSICTCGHPGDGARGSAHAGAIGHGECNVVGCPCEKFTWRSWTPAYQAVLDTTRRSVPK